MCENRYMLHQNLDFDHFIFQMQISLTTNNQSTNEHSHENLRNFLQAFSFSYLKLPVFSSETHPKIPPPVDLYSNCNKTLTLSVEDNSIMATTEEPIIPTTEPEAEPPTAEEPAKEEDPAPKPKKAAPAKKIPAPRKRSGATHPPYFEMVKDAIETLKERTGSSQYAITKFIEEKQKNLPPNFKKLLLIQLKKFVAAGKLNKVKNSYKLPPARAPRSAAASPTTKKKPAAAAAKSKAKPKPKASAAAAKDKKAVASKSKAKPKAAAAKPKPASKAKPAAKVKPAAKSKAVSPAKPKAAPKRKAPEKSKAEKKPPAKAARTSTRLTPGKKAPAAAPAKKALATKAKTAKSPAKKASARKGRK
ncbi:histone H1 [Striga asiatica]|uniref:Histone H1 n=1 Tax=Striga asiatica TaxID=4170 RepID=A0A5A7PAK8_STRAF|nr:histone H1 [Striga asiatica]